MKSLAHLLQELDQRYSDAQMLSPRYSKEDTPFIRQHAHWQKNGSPRISNANASIGHIASHAHDLDALWDEPGD